MMDGDTNLNFTYYWEDNSTKLNNTLTYVNITKELPLAYAVPLYGYLMPVLLVITMVANTLIVVVLSRRHMRTPTNVVLMVMALCDMFTLLLPAPWLIYMYTFGNHYKPFAPVPVCYVWTLMQEVSNLTNDSELSMNIMTVGVSYPVWYDRTIEKSSKLDGIWQLTNLFSYY